MKFKVVYFGTPYFAAKVLEDLLNSHIQVVAVVTRPDKPQKRSAQLIPSPVKTLAISRNIPVLQPERASSEDFIQELLDLGADVFLVVAYGAILKQQLLDVPKFGCYNLHAGLLPAYRGAAPIQRCIMDGVELSGNTVIRMDAGMDSGDIVNVSHVSVDVNMTAGDLAEKLSAGGAGLLIKTLQEIEANTIQFTPQDHSLATLAPKLTKEDGLIHWNRPAAQVHAHIRGCTPAPGAWCLFQNKAGCSKRLVVCKSVLESFEKVGDAGEVLGVDQQDLLIACSPGVLRLRLVCPENKKIMSGKDFFNGCPQIQFNNS